MNPTTHTPFRVLIVGGGVAGLEAALALRDLAGERVATTVLTPAGRVRLPPDEGPRTVRLQRGAPLPTR